MIGAIAGPALQIGGGLASSLLKGRAAKKAAAQKEAALREGIGTIQKQYGETTERYAPYEKFGGEQLNALGTFMEEKDPSAYLDPGYQFRQEQAMKGIEGTAAGKGMLKSGDTLRALETYGQDMASQEYNNAFNRYLGEGGFRSNLAGQFGMGSARDLGRFGQQSSNSIANMLGGVGEAQASGTQGAGQAWGDFASGAGNALGGMVSGFGGGGPTGPQPHKAPMPQNLFPGDESDTGY